MNYWLKLSIPLFLGLVAAFINAWTVTSKTAPRSFVRLTVDMHPGQSLTNDVVERFVIHGMSDSSDQTLVPWKDKAVLLNRPATAELHAGDPVFWRDFAPVTQLENRPGEQLFPISLAQLAFIPNFIRVGSEIDFIMGTRDEPMSRSLEPTVAEGTSQSLMPPAQASSRPPHSASASPQVSVDLIGPFRVAAVGLRVTPGGEIDNEAAGDERVLTIAARFANGKPVDHNTQRLLAAQSGLSGERIVTVALSRSKSDAATTTAVPAARAEGSSARQTSGR